jgi:hypothetical protein
MNMKRRFLTAIGSGAALAAILAASSATYADTAGSEKNFSTTLTQTGPATSSGSYTGNLRITISSDGLVNGWYIPADEPSFIPVIGGASNGRIWFDIGTSQPLRVQGSMQKDGSLTGSATDFGGTKVTFEDQAFPSTFDFVAKPQ